MFTDFEVFKIYVRRVFEDIDAERTVTRELMNFKQKKAALIYVVQF